MCEFLREVPFRNDVPVPVGDRARLCEIVPEKSPPTEGWFAERQAEQSGVGSGGNIGLAFFYLESWCWIFCSFPFYNGDLLSRFGVFLF